MVKKKEFDFIANQIDIGVQKQQALTKWTMTTSEIITLDELTDKIELESASSNFRVCAEFLLSALNDWPTMGLEEPKDLLDELRNEVNESLTFDNLDRYSKGLRISVSANAWKTESVTSLLEMFDFNRQG